MSDKKTEQDEKQEPAVESEIDAKQPGESASKGDESTGDDAEAGDLSRIVSELEAALAEARESEMRAIAEQQNVQRRADQEVTKARKFALERLVNDLLPVVDNLERAMQSMEAGEETYKAVFEGIELTYKEFMATLSRQGVEPVEPQGEPFNPEHHQAISMQEQADTEPNTVLQVIQKGYLLNGRLLRPAMVVVSKSSD